MFSVLNSERGTSHRPAAPSFTRRMLRETCSTDSSSGVTSAPSSGCVPFCSVRRPVCSPPASKQCRITKRPEVVGKSSLTRARMPRPGHLAWRQCRWLRAHSCWRQCLARSRGAAAGARWRHQSPKPLAGSNSPLPDTPLAQCTGDLCASKLCTVKVTVLARSHDHMVALMQRVNAYASLLCVCAALMRRVCSICGWTLAGRVHGTHRTACEGLENRMQHLAPLRHCPYTVPPAQSSGRLLLWAAGPAQGPSPSKQPTGRRCGDPASATSSRSALVPWTTGQ